MAMREFQTAAARVLHLERATDAAIDQLKSRFGYHPLDLEAALSVPLEPSFSAYGHYGFLTLLWPSAELDETSEIRFFVDRQQLVIIGDTPRHAIGEVMAELAQGLGSPTSQCPPAELIHVVLQPLYRQWVDSAGTGHTAAAQRLASNAAALRQLGRWLQAQDMRQAVPPLIIDAHHLDALVDRLRRPLVTATPASTVPRSVLQLPRLLSTYAVASAVMVILVIVTLSLR